MRRSRRVSCFLEREGEKRKERTPREEVGMYVCMYVLASYACKYPTCEPTKARTMTRVSASARHLNSSADGDVRFVPSCLPPFTLGTVTTVKKGHQGWMRQGQDRKKCLKICLTSVFSYFSLPPFPHGKTKSARSDAWITIWFAHILTEYHSQACPRHTHLIWGTSPGLVGCST